jgi:hypothetical protein
MTFFIKKNSSLPLLTYELTDNILNKYNITDDMLENCAITFSMINNETGIYKIANVPAVLNIETPNSNFTEFKKYTLIYQFKTKDTSKVGNYESEFVIDFMSDCNFGKLKLPVDDKIIVVVSDTITKTDVI